MTVRARATPALASQLGFEGDCLATVGALGGMPNPPCWTKGQYRAWQFLVRRIQRPIERKHGRSQMSELWKDSSNETHNDKQNDARGSFSPAGR
jgi:hypothetical protein